MTAPELDRFDAFRRGRFADFCLDSVPTRYLREVLKVSSHAFTARAIAAELLRREEWVRKMGLPHHAEQHDHGEPYHLDASAN